MLLRRASRARCWAPSLSSIPAKRRVRLGRGTVTAYLWCEQERKQRATLMADQCMVVWTEGCTRRRDRPSPATAQEGIDGSSGAPRRSLCVSSRTHSVGLPEEEDKLVFVLHGCGIHCAGRLANVCLRCLAAVPRALVSTAGARFIYPIHFCRFVSAEGR